MAVVDESFSTASFTTTAGPTFSITKPAGTVPGNLLLWFVQFEDESGAGGLAGPVITTPSGWTKLLGDNNFGNYHSWALYHRTAGVGEPASYSISVSTQTESLDCGMIMSRHSGHDPTNPINAFARNVTASPSTTDIDSPSVVTTVSGCAIYRGGGLGRSTAMPVPSGTTAIASINVSFAASEALARDNTDLSPAGATGTKTWAAAGNSSSKDAFTLAIAPFVATAPGAPQNLSAVAAGAGQIDLDWDAPASDGGSPITGYKIERESPVGGGFSVLVADTGSTSTAYSDTGLLGATQYNYRVSAINAVGTGPASGEANATTIPSGHGGNAGQSPAAIAQAGRERIQRAASLNRRDFWDEMLR